MPKQQGFTTEGKGYLSVSAQTVFCYQKVSIRVADECKDAQNVLCMQIIGFYTLIMTNITGSNVLVHIVLARA